jgi:conjugative relaxase-like TrwC/TraI family protein
MLSIGKIALGQHRYYEQQVAHGRDDYYSGRGEAPGEWVGAGARALGLARVVAGSQFNALIAGSDPRDPSARLRRSAKEPSVAALDLTFSAPKSVSVLAAVAPDNVTAKLIMAHEEALRAAIVYLEDTAVLVRRGHDGERVEPGEGLIAVAYRHRMSRALDPQLHTHVVAANMTRGPDGRYTALHATPLYRAAKTAGYLYQAHLRATVSDRLGLQWGEVRKGAAELLAVPSEVLAEFSKRRLQMLTEAERGGIGLGSKASGEKAAIATRERKQYGIDTHTWREEVRARASELGLGRDELDALPRAGRRWRRPRRKLDERAIGDALTGPKGLTERANTYDEREVLQRFAAEAGQGASVQEVRGQVDRFLRRGDVLATMRGGLTTSDLVACERRLIAAAVGRAGEGIAVVDPRTIDSAIDSTKRPLTAEQAAVVWALASSGSGVEVVEALAGTGKTYSAGVLRGVYERAGYEVLGVAPTGRGARELSEHAGIRSRTLDRMLIDLYELGDELPERSVIVLDEAGMAPTRSSARLLEAAERAGAKVTAIGDPGQLSSVQAGGWLRAVGRELHSLRLTEVMRQRDPSERRSLAALHEGQPQRYIEWAERRGRIETHERSETAIEAAIADWARAIEEVGPDQAVLIARDNDTRETLNHAARELWRALGLLGEEHSYGSQQVAVGDRVICRRNDALLDLDNGTRGAVRHAGADRIVIETDSHLMRELSAQYVSEHVEHAYALTGHGMQGATVEAAIVVASPRDLSAGWSYTALSRARGSTRLLIHDEQSARERTDLAPQEHQRPAERSELLARAQRRMLERDDEDLAIEQLPPAGRADDRDLAAARAFSTEPTQEHAAVRAEPTQPAAATPARLRELGERIERLQAQLWALPTRQLQRIEDLDELAHTLFTQHERLAEHLVELPEPRRQFGRERDPHAIERHRLTSWVGRCERELDAVLTERTPLERELGDPAATRTERDGLVRAIRESTKERSAVLDELSERELHAPAAWVKEHFGEAPDEPSAREEWESGVRKVTHHRAQYEITDPSDALGPLPEHGEQQHDWERAREAIERGERRLGRDVGAEHGRDLDLDLGF